MTPRTLAQNLVTDTENEQGHSRTAGLKDAIIRRDPEEVGIRSGFCFGVHIVISTAPPNKMPPGFSGVPGSGPPRVNLTTRDPTS